jgi:hypothetical protein
MPNAAVSYAECYDSPVSTDRTPLLEYANALPERSGWERRWPWVVSVGSALIVAFFFTVGLLCQSWTDTPEFIALAVWGAAVVYVVARSCSGDARLWLKAQRAVSAATAVMSGIDVFLNGDLIYSMKAAYTHGWGIVYMPPISQVEIIVMIVAIGWFGVAPVWDRISQQAERV